jgi:alpha-tubulin suppressor-like RCC1 family protein
MKISSYLFSVLLVFGSFSSSAQLCCFSPATNHALGTSPNAMTSADFNGDGYADVATANDNTNDISILLGNGNGGFFAGTEYTSNYGSRSIISADFNGDGNLDLATANGASGNVSILIGNGSGTFSAATYFTAGGGPISVVSADFNGDGNKDLAVANYNSSNVSILLGNGSGAFSAATNVSTGINPFSVTTADFNGDGNADIATATQSSTNVSVLLGNGTGGFSAPTSFTVGSGPVSVISTDLNGDGLIDLATANINGNNVSVILGNGAGSFSAPTNYAVGSYPRSIITADFNGDGKKDLAVANQDSHNASVLLGNGLGAFIPAINVPTGTTPRSIAAAHFNGDGIMDFVTGNSGENNLSLLLGRNTISISQSSSCSLGATGTATASPICGTPPYSYLWNTTPAQTTSMASGLASGTYTVTVLDATNVPKTASVTIVNFPALVVSTSQTSILCGGGTNGTATASVSGGTLPYYYSWNTSPVQTTPTATNLSAGNYSITVTDAYSCPKTESVTITELPEISIATTVVNRSCASFFGPNDGSASATVTGGTAPYSYSWNTSPVQITPVATGLNVGNYTLTVTDANNCVKTATVTISSPPEITVSTVQTNILCFGGNNGSTTATASGGVPPYTYLWNTVPAQTNPTISNLIAGDYSLTVTDFNGCSFPFTTVDIAQPYEIVVQSYHDNVTCIGCNDGGAWVVVSGGTPPYSYSWSNGGSGTAGIDNLAPGNYTVVVTDANNCTESASVTIEEYVEPPAATSQSFAAGAGHNLFVCSDNTVMSVGIGTYGALGIGPTANQATAVAITSLTGITEVAAGAGHSLFLKNDGTVWATGRNVHGQLGDGTTTERSSPVQVSGLTGITKIDDGKEHSLFLKTDGTVWAVGWNDYGQLGDGTLNPRTTPVQVSGLTGITAMAGGQYHSIFLKSDGTVWTCGASSHGQLGIGSNNSPISTAVQISGLTGITAVEAGEFHSVFLKNDGTVWTCGDNSYGQLGDGTETERSTPVQVSGFSVITAIAAGTTHTLFTKNDNTAWGVGSNSSGELGDGTLTRRSTPVQVIGLSGITAIDAGYAHSLFLKNDGTVWAIGWNAHGQLGDGTVITRITPTQVIGLCGNSGSGIEDNVIANDISIYPNPSNGQLTIEVKYISMLNKEASLQIYNALGARVYSQNIRSSKTELDLSGNPSGMYFYQLNEAESILKTGKIMIAD